MSENKIHGIAVTERKTKELVEFIPCAFGNPALRILSGIRINMSPDYKAEETFVTQKEVDSIKK